MRRAWPKCHCGAGLTRRVRQPATAVLFDAAGWGIRQVGFDAMAQVAQFRAHTPLPDFSLSRR